MCLSLMKDWDEFGSNLFHFICVWFSWNCSEIKMKFTLQFESESCDFGVILVVPKFLWCMYVSWLYGLLSSFVWHFHVCICWYDDVYVVDVHLISLVDWCFFHSVGLTIVDDAHSGCSWWWWGRKKRECGLSNLDP